MPLTDTQIRNARPQDKPIQLVDGFGLYLEVRPTGARHWRMRYRLDGKESRISIGQYPLMSLKDARAERERIRALLAEGISPIEEKRAEKAIRRKQARDTFEQIAREWLDRRAGKWTPYYQKGVLSCLEQNAFPAIGSLPIRRVTSAHILSILQAMEERGVHTYAIQLRQWISAIFRHAIVTLRADVDPAAPLKGAIDRPVIQHARCLSREEIDAFREAVDAYKGNRTTVLALKLLLYTFVRTIEARTARWEDIQGGLWVIPAGRMKMRRTHSVPLSKQARAVIDELRTITGSNQWLFPGTRDPTTHMSGTTVNRALEYMGVAATGHDFRATASTWLNEMGFRLDVIERQLAHVEANQTRRAYNHALYLDERRDMMQKWADWVDSSCAV
jgi:integrase